jgi:hypothetical protein
MKPALLLLVFALLMTACQPALDSVSTPTAQAPVNTPAPTETPPTSQADSATLLTSTLQSQLDETCQTDPLLCQAYEAYKNSRQTDPLHSLALGLLETSADNQPFTLAIDPINGEPVVYLDSSENFAGGLLRLAIGGDEGHLFISTSPYGENARISHEGPGLANAYDEDGQLLGCVSAKTGQWVDASELAQADRKAMIAFAGQMALLARQVVDGKMTLAEATMGMNTDERMSLSKIFIKEKNPLNPTGKIFTTVEFEDYSEWKLPRKEWVLATPATIEEDGFISYMDPSGKIVKTNLTLSYFTNTELISQTLASQNELTTDSSVTQPTHFSISEGVVVLESTTPAHCFVPAIVYGIIKNDDEFVIAPATANNENRTIILQFGVPTLSKNGDLLFLEIVYPSLHSDVTVFINNSENGKIQVFSSWHNYKQPGIKVENFKKIPPIYDQNGSFVVIELAGSTSRWKDRKQLLNMWPIITSIFWLEKD